MDSHDFFSRNVNLHDNCSPINLEDDNDPNIGSSQKRRNKRHTSDIWEIFTVDEPNKRAICILCKKSYAWVKGQGTGTGTLRKHKDKHMNEIGHLDTKKTQITSFTNTSGTFAFSNFCYSWDRMRVGISEFLAASEMPFTFAEDRYFEFMQKYVQPAYRSVSRNTANSNILKLFHTMTE